MKWRTIWVRLMVCLLNFAGGLTVWSPAYPRFVKVPVSIGIFVFDIVFAWKGAKWIIESLTGEYEEEEP